eukprot:4179297-Alexandrium_andersonii.AAC.1
MPCSYHRAHGCARCATGLSSPMSRTYCDQSWRMTACQSLSRSSGSERYSRIFEAMLMLRRLGTSMGRPSW